MDAKAGDTITEKARKRHPLDQIPTKVESKSAGEKGQWFCITCGDLPPNNLSASSHDAKHKLAWRSFDSGKIEAPSDADDDSNEVKVGDLREGTGGMRVRVQVLALGSDAADCLLVRSGNRKTISLTTLKKAYRLVERGKETA